MNLTKNWKVRYQILKEEAKEWEAIADGTAQGLEELGDILNKNMKLLKDYGYDGRYSKPERVIWKPRIFWWESKEIKADKERELAKYPEELRELKQKIKSGTAPKDWWESVYSVAAGEG